jgi:hypothetical protein
MRDVVDPVRLSPASTYSPWTPIRGRAGHEEDMAALGDAPG